MAANHSTAPISLVSQANDVLYSLLEKTKFQHMKMPADINLLTFSKRGLDVKYRELLFCNPQNKVQYSPDLLRSLIMFYFFVTGYFLLTLVVSLVYQQRGQISTEQVLVQTVPLAVLLLGYYSVLYLTRSKRACLINIRSLFCALNVLLICYLVCTDKQLLSRYFDEDQTHLFANNSIVLMFFMFASLIVTMYHFVTILIQSVVLVVLHLAVKVGFSTYEALEVLQEMVIVCTFCILLCFLSYQREYRSRQIFYQLQQEEQAHSGNQKPFAPDTIDKGFKSEIEKAADLCDSIRKIVKDASTVIIYNDVRSQLKDAMGKVEEVRDKIVRGVFVEHAEVELPQVDEDNAKYLRQMYLDKSIIIRKNTLLSKKTLRDLPITASLPDYGQDDLNEELKGIGSNWNFDIWKVYEKVSQSVYLVANFLMVKWELSNNYDLDEGVMNTCFTKIEKGYKDNPYHNACHAADVCHSLVYFINNSEMAKKISGLDLLASLLASLGHDISHPGVTSRYLIVTQDDLAIFYNDISVLENMHASTLFTILNQGDSNVLEDVPMDDALVIRKLIIEMILETDMSKHFASVGRFRSISRKPGIDFEKQEDKFFCLAFALKCADVAHSAKSLDIHVKWTERVTDEFFKQGDLERNRGLEISMFCDRDTADVPKGQVTFLSVICKPMYETWTEYLKSEEVIVNCRTQLERNLEYWENRASGKRAASPDDSKPAKLVRFFTMAEKKKVDD